MTFQRLAIAATLLTFLVSAGFVATRIAHGVDTNILSLLPGDANDPVVADAMQKMSMVASARIAFSIEGRTATERSKAASELERALVASGLFRSSAEDGKELWKWLFAYRAELLCPDDRARLETGDGASIAQRALADWYAPMSPARGTMADSDPMLRTNKLLTCLLPKGMATAPDMPAQIVSGSVVGSVYSLDVQDQITSIVARWKTDNAHDGLQLSRAGAVFHAAYGAEHARSEMSLIGLITTIAVLLFYWMMFRSLRAPLIAVGMVTFSLTVGLAAALLVFGSVHAMALVFGAALIGMVVDYTTYYLVTGLAQPENTPDERKAGIFRPLTLGMLTSVAAFAALFFFPVAAFRQIALFGGVGLIAAWVTTLVLTPAVEGKPMRVGPGAMLTKNYAGQFLGARFPMGLFAGVLLLSLVIVVLALQHGKTLDDVRRFQGPSPQLVKEEAHLRALIGFAPSSSFILVQSDEREEAIAREEKLLATLRAAGRGDAVIWAASQFDPTVTTRAHDRELIKTKLLDPYLARLQMELGGGGGAAYATSGEETPVVLPVFVSGLRGETKGTYWSVMPVSQVAFILPDMVGVSFIDPAQRYSNLLGLYRSLATYGLAGAVLATGFMLLIVYRSVASLKILMPTVLALLISPAVLSLAGVPFSFFSVMGLFLVVGAGVDYAIFQWENPDKDGDWTRVGIVLAATMTCISVGLLGFSSVLPVRSFGLTVAVGILISLLLSPLVRVSFAGNLFGGKRDD
ncbi:MAG: MMPL family transporter [Parvibaculaceae bacterium]